MNLTTQFHGPNVGYILDLYERYQRDPHSVDAATRAFFATWTPPVDALLFNGRVAPQTAFTREETTPSSEAAALDKVVAVVNLAQAIREYGHLAAQIDPLGSTPPGDPALELSYYDLTEDDLAALPCSLIGGPVVERVKNSFEAIQELRRIYSGTIGYDYDHLRVPAEREWLRAAAESRRFHPPNDPINPVALLERLTQVETFEHFLQRTYPGKTRFSIEGLDMMVPILDEIIGAAAESGIYSILIGMAHRGRLNVLAHTLNKPYRDILLEFKDNVDRRSISMRDHLGWTGDVKYHAGALRALPSSSTMDLTVRMAPNPSHLEHVNPVVEGMARADGTYTDEPGPPRFDHHISLSVVIHGDAAFPGQGIVAETLNFSRLEGYRTGGTLHIIANNQLGFTTLPADTRSTLYASDLAKGFKIPIVHVNADDPTACIEAARLAAAYRNEFQKDFLIDLIGYRRYGHNEGDEPRFTQPVMYATIEKHPTVRQLWAERLVQDGSVASEEPDALVETQIRHLQETLDELTNLEPEVLEPDIEPPPPGAARKVSTAVPAEQLRDLHAALQLLPDGFMLNPRLQRIFKRRTNVLDDPDAAAIDWGLAEGLALASILAEGISVRLTGEDAERGTFSHRHAVLHDAKTGQRFVPLHAIPQAKAAFEIHNSPLTENAAVGFEYGYNIQAPERLVLWEAQYGDFVNTAQPMIDEFIVSGRAKWEQTPSLVLLLPHGYEGQGPDHSTGRLERFLQLAAETNIRIANPSTSAQYFHLLRRQALLLGTDPLPLIVMTPKSLLRHPVAASSLRDLSEGRWQPVIDDAQAAARGNEIRRVVLCSGKVYVDLMGHELRATSPSVAIVRVEQLYPFPVAEIATVLTSYPNLTEVVWLQEEPQNMGAWSFAQPLLAEWLAAQPEKLPIRYVGRPSRANPAEGSSAWHLVNQMAIVEQAYSTVAESPTQK